MEGERARSVSEGRGRGEMWGDGAPWKDVDGRRTGDDAATAAPSPFGGGTPSWPHRREIWGDMGRYGEIWGDMGDVGEMTHLAAPAVPPDKDMAVG